MATRQIKHRYGSIDYEFNDQIAWTQTDQQMADGLAHCILISERSINETDALFKRSSALHKSIEKLSESHKTVSEKLRKAQDLAGGYVGAIELGQYAIADALSNATNMANEALQTQNEEIQQLHALYSQLLKDHNAKIDREEEEHQTVYNQLNALFKLGYESKNLATNLIGFDRATETLRSLVAGNRSSEDAKMNRVHEVIRDYELLQARIEGQQMVWEEFCSRLTLIEYIGKLRSGMQPRSFN